MMTSNKIEDDLTKNGRRPQQKMEDNLKKIKNGRRLQKKMEDELKKNRR